MSADEAFEERTIGDWTSYQDDEGRTYYYNSVTEESLWDPPPGFDDDAARDSDADGVQVLTTTEVDGGQMQTTCIDDRVTKASTTDSNNELNRSPSMNADEGISQSPTIDNDGISQSPVDDQADENEDDFVDGEEIGGGWIAYKDDEERTYYYNSESGETQWERPDVTPAVSGTDVGETKTAEDEGDYMDASPIASDRDERKEIKTEQKIVDTSVKQKDDPATIAENFLREPDAIMESQVLDHISTLVTAIGPQEAGKKAMQSLINGYQGDTAICGLMALWLAELKASNAASNKSSNPPSILGKQDVPIEKRRFEEGTNAARDVVEKVVNRLAKERFTKDGGDAIMLLSKKQVAFVDAMIESERWRNLLIDLSATNTDTKLFMYCLQSISNKGHHRAIANRINQSYYFGVLNSMLGAELSLLGKIAIDGFSKQASESIDTSKGPMGSLIQDLRRTCTTTSYTYLYTKEILRELICKTETWASNNVSNADAFKHAAKKWTRLQEELEDEMLKTQITGTTFQRKRRIDVVLAMGDLVQRQRRRMIPSKSSNASMVTNSSNTSLANILDSSIANFLTKCSLGNPIDKESVESIFKYAYSGSTDRIGDLLIKHPLSITFLLRNMFGTKRSRQLEIRQKCARLVALAIIASERDVQSMNNLSTTTSDEDALCQVLLKGSQLCEQVEAMVSFAVLDKADSSDSSVGRQLSALCIKYSVIAEGALVWAEELASEPEFVIAAAYPTLAPCILSLARLICIYHPLARPAVLKVSLIFIGHSNREISHQKMQSIKEQCLRLMIWLSTQGMVLEVISALREKLQKSSSELDSALVRYFVSNLLDVIESPFSLPFIRSIGGMFIERSCIDTLTSPLFDSSNKSRLSALIIQFEKAFAAEDETLSDGDRHLLSTLKSTYSFTASE